MKYAELKWIEIYPYKNVWSYSSWDYELIEDLSYDEWIVHYSTKKLEKWDDINSYFSIGDIKRDDPSLIETIESLKEEVNWKYWKIIIVDVPDDVERYIDEYDWWETVREKHREW